MKRIYFQLGFFIIIIFLFLVSCGGSSTEGDDDGSGGGVVVTETVAAVSVEADSNTVVPEASTGVTAHVYNSSGGPVSGVDVIFTISSPALAYITSTSTTDGAGAANAIFTARTLSGEVEVTATAGSISSDPPKTISILDQAAPQSITLNVNPATIIVEGTSTVTATVLGALGVDVPNGTTVTFTVDNSSLGTITASSVTNSNTATATFEATDNAGSVAVTAHSGAVDSAPATITIEPSPATFIEFDSAVPELIAIKGSGGTEISTIKFTVKDTNGNGVPGVNVTFEIHDGLGGGEYINPSDLGPQIDVSTTATGIAQCILYSGSVAGPITITGTIATPSMTVSSSVVSIGGGISSDGRFSVAAETLNLPGLGYANRTSDITAYIADRFGNYNILDGTTVSFVTETGLSVNASDISANELGTATGILRTEGAGVIPKGVVPLGWEVTLQGYVLATYGYAATGHPRDGLCSVLIHMKGEEHFDDTNANGVYDSGEPFVDTRPDPFCDYNDNDSHDDGSGTDPFEPFVSADASGNYNGTPNGEWDSDKLLFRNFKILHTGQPIVRLDTADGFIIADGGSAIIKVLVCDHNLNPISPGSTATVTTDAGKLSGTTSIKYPDGSAIGPDSAAHLNLIEFSFVLSDSDAGDTDDPEKTIITVDVVWEGLTTTKYITGTID
jgi:hypothetical protein